MRGVGKKSRGREERWRAFTLVLALGFILPWSRLRGDEPARFEVRVGLYENQPKIYTSDAGTPAGFFPALVDLFAGHEGWEVVYVPGSWQEGLERLERAEIDVMPDVAHTREREERFVFGEETALISWAAIYTRLGEDVSSFFDLEGKRLAVLRGSVYDRGEDSLRAIMQRFEIEAEFVGFDSHAGIFEAIERGEVDAGVVNNIFGSSQERYHQVVRTPIVFSPARLHFAFPRDGPLTSRLQKSMDRLLREWKADAGSAYHQAMNRHLYDVLVADRPPAEDGDVLTPEERAWLDDHPVIRLGYDPEFFPFEFRDEQGRFAGMAAEYVDLLARRYGVHMTPVDSSTWPDVMEQMARRNLDVLACVGYSAERAGYLLFSMPYLEYQRVVLTRVDLPFLTGLDDLRGVRVAVQQATSHEDFLREETALSYTSYPSVREAVLALSSGQVDALVGNLASFAYWIRRLHLTNLKVAAPASTREVTLHFAVRQDWPELVGIINRCLAAVDEATHRDIRHRWVGLEYDAGDTRRATWRAVWRTGLVAALLLGVVLCWLARLKREIGLRQCAEASLKEYADDMTRLNVRLEEMDRLKNMFIASVSHELRTPLNSIIGFSGVLLKGMTGPLNDRQHDQLRRINASAQHLLELITDIIDISKIEAGRVDSYPQTFPLRDVLDECSRAVQPQLADRPLELSVDMAGEITLFADRKRLRQCLLNYLSNAIKYSERGTIRVTAREQAGNRLEVAVEDSGIGIAPEDQQRLFQPFERMDSHLRVRAGGTGLGLYLTRKIAREILHGDTAVESVPGRGSRFSLTLPLHGPPSAASTPADPQNPVDRAGDRRIS